MINSKTDKKVELLAPAGNYEAFVGAVNAGADAVYLGGEKFGARAYADNFSTEEICRAIHVAHFMGRRVYLTVNTLLKNDELSELTPYLQPFYEAGLDGVIVQDIGVLCHIRDHFPGLALHASTQMTLTGPEGCAFLKEQGVERVVPARELSLTEVRSIKEQTGLEIECFIHGAMCYCYSGQCLFSSVLGGRSGNRGRCAQPCRLPYRISDGKKEIKGIEYPLSLKDMCTISYIPRLIEAGIDSFKIEGRMKKPEYAAGVTALYRKYIDLYYQEGAENYKVSGEDMDILQSLYIRSEIQTGYYERQNGPEMITLHQPSYAGGDETTLAQIRAAYLREPDKLPIRMKICLQKGKPSLLEITEEKGTAVSVTGAVVESAQKAPLQRDDVRKRFQKTGNYCVTVSDCEIEMEDDVFLPVRALNELRRKGVEAFETEYIRKRMKIIERSFLYTKPTESVTGTVAVDIRPDISNNIKIPNKTNIHDKSDISYKLNISDKPNLLYKSSISDKSNLSDEPAAFDMADNTRLPETALSDNDNKEIGNKEVSAEGYVDILVSTLEQLSVAVQYSNTHTECRRIYIDSNLYLTEHQQVAQCMRSGPEVEYYIALPYIIRTRDAGYIEQLTKVTENDYLSGIENPVKGFLTRCYEEVAYIRRINANNMHDIHYEMVLDAGLYCFNAEGLRFWAHYVSEYTLPYELNRKEAGRLAGYGNDMGMCAAMIVYGRIPMMITANCIRKTAGQCTGHAMKKGSMYLRDRYEVTFPVEINCIHCYNIIYNSVPYSLHTQKNVVQKVGAAVRRYDFTVETAKECQQILTGDEFPFVSYTTGHLKRGVE